MKVTHPSELNYWQVYRQASQLLKNSSLGKNPDWFREPYQLDRQWHLWVDGVTCQSAVFDKKAKHWEAGPDLSPELLKGEGFRDAAAGEEIVKALKACLTHPGLGGRARSLGVVVHLADEFSVNELAPEHAQEEDPETLNELLANDPASALGDATVDRALNSWRLIPGWGLKEEERRSFAIQVSRRFQGLIDRIGECGKTMGVPVIVAGYCAPLEALRLAPLMAVHEDLKVGSIFVFLYRRFSTLAAIGPKGELMLLRSLQHRGGLEHPSGLGEALVNSSALLKLPNPEVHIIQMAPTSPHGLVPDLERYFENRPRFNIGFTVASAIKDFGEIAGGRLEMAIGDEATVQALHVSAPRMATETFQQLAGGWAMQNFFGLSRKEKDACPGQKDFELLRLSKWFKSALTVAVLALMVWTGWGVFKTVSRDSWQLSEVDARASKERHENLMKEKERLVYWENLMTRRSEGWLALEVPLSLIPEESGIVVSEFKYDTGALSDEKEKSKAGFYREWTIKGFARTEGQALLSKLGSKANIAAHLDDIAKATATATLVTGDKRNVDVTLQQRQGQMPASLEFPTELARFYRVEFELRIRHEVSPGDRMSLNITAPPPAP